MAVTRHESMHRRLTFRLDRNIIEEALMAYISEKTSDVQGPEWSWDFSFDFNADDDVTATVICDHELPRS